MNHRLSIRLPDELAEGIDERVKHTGKTKSEVVREALKLAGVRVVRHDPAKLADLLERAARLRAGQPKPREDVVTMLRRIRDDPLLRLPLRRLTVPFLAVDLA